MKKTKRLFWYSIAFIVLAGCSHTPAGSTSSGYMLEGGRAAALVAELYSAIHTGSPIFVVATAQHKPKRLLCHRKICKIIVDRNSNDEELEPSGGRVVQLPSATQWVTLHISEVLAGNIDKNKDINAVNLHDCSSKLEDSGGVNHPNIPDLWPLMDKFWNKPGIYLLRKTRTGGPEKKIMSHIACEGNVDIKTPYTYYPTPSWKDSGGYGWYTIEDIKKIINYLKTHELPQRPCQMAQLWVDLTGNPIPDEGISGCPLNEVQH